MDVYMFGECIKSFLFRNKSVSFDLLPQEKCRISFWEQILESTLFSDPLNRCTIFQLLGMFDTQAATVKDYVDWESDLYKR